MGDSVTPELDLVIPVYNEGPNIRAVLDALGENVRTSFRVLICYDRDDDDTLTELAGYTPRGFDIVYVKNRRQGALGAVLTGFEASTAPAALVTPADDDYNAGRIDDMMRLFREGNDIVAASRFMPGGCMEGCPWLKAVLVRSSAFALYNVAKLPTRDASNGLRLFSRRVLTQIPIESEVGFAYSLELLAKSHRLGWRVAEVPFQWYERKAGQSRFKVVRWLPQYLRWFGYAFATTYLRLGPETVKLRTVEAPVPGSRGASATTRDPVASTSEDPS